MESMYTPEKEDRRIRKTKKALRDSLFMLLEKKHINQITVTELTKAADVNRSTFYLYYSDVFDMVKRIQGEIYDMLVKNVVNCPHSFSDPDGFYDYCVRFLDFCKDNYYICRFITRNDCYNKQLADMIKKAVCDVIPDSAKHFENGDPRYYMTTFAFSGILSVVLEWMNDGMKIPPHDLARFLSYTYVLGSKMQKEGDFYKSYSFFKEQDSARL